MLDLGSRNESWGSLFSRFTHRTHVNKWIAVFKPSSETCTRAVGMKEQKFTLLCRIRRLAMSGNWAEIWIARSVSYLKRKGEQRADCSSLLMLHSRVPQTRRLKQWTFHFQSSWSKRSVTKIWASVASGKNSAWLRDGHLLLYHFFCAMWRKLFGLSTYFKVPVLWDKDPTQMKNDIRSMWL